MNQFPLSPASYSLAEEFGLDRLDKSIQIAGYQPGHPAAPDETAPHRRPGAASTFSPGAARRLGLRRTSI